MRRAQEVRLARGENAMLMEDIRSMKNEVVHVSFCRVGQVKIHVDGEVSPGMESERQ